MRSPPLGWLEAQEKQALHRRLMAAREAGTAPDIDDTLAAADHAVAVPVV